ncbi:hypothetical protein B0H14DRAFT_2638189 [Mycena olivaceomarginata]|nr:hypothetical protein B0H14DRAFT_2638189 [Mycena olivaceomarginata]
MRTELRTNPNERMRHHRPTRRQTNPNPAIFPFQHGPPELGRHSPSFSLYIDNRARHARIPVLSPRVRTKSGVGEGENLKTSGRRGVARTAAISAGKVRFGSGSDYFSLNTELKPGVRFKSTPNLEPDPGFGNNPVECVLRDGEKCVLNLFRPEEVVPISLALHSKAEPQSGNHSVTGSPPMYGGGMKYQLARERAVHNAGVATAFAASPRLASPKVETWRTHFHDEVLSEVAARVMKTTPDETTDYVEHSKPHTPRDAYSRLRRRVRLSSRTESKLRGGRAHRACWDWDEDKHTKSAQGVTRDNGRRTSDMLYANLPFPPAC